MVNILPIHTNICNFSDDNTLYACDTRLNADTNIVIQWFKCNSMVANPEKFQLMFLGTEDSNISYKVDLACQGNYDEIYAPLDGLDSHVNV